jgi:hypothetical protein
MTPEDALILVTKLALIDPRLKRTDPTDMADMATGWSEAFTLHGVTLAEALPVAVRVQSMRLSSEPALTPGDIIAALGVSDEAVPDLTAAHLVRDRARQLEAAGVSESDLVAHRGDPDWLAAHFPARGRPCAVCGGTGQVGWAGDLEECEACDGFGEERAAIDA